MLRRGKKDVYPEQARSVSGNNKGQGETTCKPKILFVAEAVTLAHVARPAVLANGLDHDVYEVTFATDPRYNELFPELSDYRRDIWSIPSEDFLNALAKGSPLYSKRILERYYPMPRSPMFTGAFIPATTIRYHSCR